MGNRVFTTSSLGDPACPQCEATSTTVRDGTRQKGTWRCIKCNVRFFPPTDDRRKAKVVGGMKHEGPWWSRRGGDNE